MAELQFPDIAGSFQQGQRLGTLQRLQGEGEQRRSTLASLAQQAYSAPQDQRQGIIGQAVGVDPEAGFALEKGVQGSEDSRTRSLVNAAKLLTSAPAAQRPGLYQQMKPGLSQFGLQLPDQYDDETVGKTALALVQAYGDIDKTTPAGVREFNGLTQGLSPDDVMAARRVKLGLDGRASSSGFTQVKFTGADGRERIGVLNGQTGQIDLPDGTSFNPQTGQVAQTQGGQQQGPQPGTYQTPNGVMRIGDLTPEQFEAAQADMAAGGTASNVTMPPRNLSPGQYGAGPSPFIGRSPEEQAALTEQARTGVQLDNLPRELQMRIDAAIQQAVGIETGKNAAERAAAAPATIETLQNSLDSIDELLNSPDLESIVGLGSLNPLNKLPGNKARGLIARADQVAGQAFLAAFNQLKGGGAITEREGAAATAAMARLDRSQSLEDYKLALTDLRNAIMPAMERARQQARGGPSAPVGPQPGTVQDGYRFRGGDPANQNSWERL